ncbi:MAG: tRNA (adenosine(37)-N6)-threonylcarbamoyltransferase complex ATPase subunit type 1 TsaE [Rhodospirillaceae bacterium]|nr:tRNA (adenosine(37)-N6)-threonylcarbamoyltransferase complex ATPase subunit type 1 TsaE [Rhodospirillaceae bacterium]
MPSSKRYSVIASELALTNPITKGSDTDARLVHRVMTEAAMNVLAKGLANVATAGDLIAIHGALGAGKSTLARRFIHSFARRHNQCVDEVPSPTFTLVQTYPLGNDVVWHFDLYRISAAEELGELGLEDALSDICLIEWPDRAAHLLPPSRLDIHLEHTANDLERQVTLVGHGDTGCRLLGSLDRMEPTTR